jgi:GntR family transcriptional repressor for pyruvate dehydrogenase complex
MHLVRTQKRVFEDILEYFKGLIRKGKIKPGDRLMSERELAAEMKVSRASLREAFRALEMLGFLSINPGKGTYILSPNTRSLSEFTELTMYLRPTLFENILEVRVIIECAAVRLAAKRASQEELAYIKNALEKMMLISRGVGLAERASEADSEFHKGIIRATHNDFLIFLYEIIGVLLKRSTEKRWAESMDTIPNAFDVIIGLHKGIFEAVMEGDEGLAEKLLREHFGVLNKKKYANEKI